MSTETANVPQPESAQDTANQKRKWRLDWEEYYMSLAFVSGQRSKDPKCQVGCCIVNPTTKRIVSLGYNGFPDGCSDDILSWEEKKKMFYVCHAELNAILNKISTDVRECDVYVTRHPCNECAKAIIQSGIKRVVYYDVPKLDKEDVKAAQEMFELVNLECIQYQRKGNVSLVITHGEGETREELEL